MWINPETLKTSEEPLDGYETVLPTQPPLTVRLEKAVSGTPELVDGMWYETWVLEPLTYAEEAQVIEAERVNGLPALLAPRQAFKAQRAEAVQNIAVTTSAGNTFDGDEVSQGRMARAILALPEGQTVRWVLHDNTEIDATGAELREALTLAGAEQARLWVG
jgi:hypothetical protein